MKKKELIHFLLANTKYKDDYLNYPLTINDTKWTLAELFIRQELDNGCDGFGLKNVAKVYVILKAHQKQLKRWKMISEKGTNNSGHFLWNNYNI